MKYADDIILFSEYSEIMYKPSDSTILAKRFPSLKYEMMLEEWSASSTIWIVESTCYLGSLIIPGRLTSEENSA